VLALQALQTDIGTQPGDQPLVIAAWVRLLKTDDIAQIYFNYHG
jgi:hypothetical protein